MERRVCVVCVLARPLHQLPHDHNAPPLPPPRQLQDRQEIFVLIWLILYLQNRSTLHDVGCMYEHSVDGRGRSSW